MAIIVRSQPEVTDILCLIHCLPHTPQGYRIHKPLLRASLHLCQRILYIFGTYHPVFANAQLYAETLQQPGQAFHFILCPSAVCTIICDSINLDEHERKFTYYGTQFIKRRSRDLKRSIVTVGELENVPRTANNPHGLLIVNWRTLENKDLDY